MILRKILNLPNSVQRTAILDDVVDIQQACKKMVGVEQREQRKSQKSHDERCPKCRAMQDNIVDRIASVVGNGKISGNLFKINSHIIFETKPVNHCNSCGHEWEKFKTKTITDLRVMKVVLNYLREIIKNPETQKKFSWKFESIEIFKKSYAEAIYMIQKKHKKYVRNFLTLRELRKNYRSIFDEE